jgi:DNA modification methylase
MVCADADHLLPALPTDCVDAVVTDPPWNLGRQYGRRTDRLPDSDYVHWLNRVFTECSRISRGPVVACIGSHNTHRIGRLLAGTGLQVAHRLAWYRQPDGPEAVIVCAPAGWTAAAHLLERADRVLRTTGEARRRWGHPVPKPVPVMAALVRLACPAGALVLDPFAGVGSTLVAARAAGRRAIGIDLEESFCRTTADRLRRGDRSSHSGSVPALGNGGAQVAGGIDSISWPAPAERPP